VEEVIGVKKYIIRFVIAYILLIFIISIIEILFSIDTTDTTSSFIASIMGASMYTILKFIENNKRIPYNSEKIKLVWLSLFVIWIHLLISFILNYDTLKINYLWSSLTLLVVSIILYITLNFIYGRFAKIQYNIMKQKGKI
jgi:hypothetical protein